jgi:hypothetical protein
MSVEVLSGVFYDILVYQFSETLTELTLKLRWKLKFKITLLQVLGFDFRRLAIPYYSTGFTTMAHDI